MTELEKITYAKSFLDKLANGINPIDGTVVPEGDLVNNVRISRCFFYVSDLLRQMIEARPSAPRLIPPPQKRTRAPKEKKSPFHITREQAEEYSFSAVPVSATAIAKKLSFLLPEVREGKMEKLSYRKINQWLLNLGMLEWQENENGRFQRIPSKAGEEIGLLLTYFDSYGRSVPCVMYTEEAQRFIIDHIEMVQATEIPPKSSSPYKE